MRIVLLLSLLFFSVNGYAEEDSVPSSEGKEWFIDVELSNNEDDQPGCVFFYSIHYHLTTGLCGDDVTTNNINYIRAMYNVLHRENRLKKLRNP